MPSACGRHPLANPVLIAVTLVSIVVVASGTSFPAYFAGAQFVHFLLGPATVALAVPLVRHLPQVRRALVPMLVALVAGSATAIGAAMRGRAHASRRCRRRGKPCCRARNARSEGATLLHNAS